MATARKPDKVTRRPTTVKKAGAAKAAPKRAPAKKSPAKKAVAKKSPAGRAPAKKAAAKRAPAKRAPAKRTPAKKAAARAPATKVAATPARSPYKAKFIEEMKVRLQAERAKYLHSAEEYRAEADALIDAREPGDVQFDEEGGEGDTLAVERERDMALSNQARHAVDQIDAALDRIAKGTYGLCTSSGQPIPQERLRAIPWAAERVEYKVGGFGRL
jgi:RNA polymerase-binding transcription factor DksA